MPNQREGTTQQGKTVHANGIDIYYQAFGDGDPLICLHGSMGTGNVWKPYAAPLSQDFYLLLPDARGHGKTVNSGDEISLNSMTDDLAALIDALDLERPFICGWSMGGDLGLNLAMRYPDQVGGLVVGGVIHRLPDTYFASLQGLGIDGPGQVNVERAEKNIPQLVALWQAEHVQSPSHWIDLAIQLSFEMYNPNLPSEDDLKKIKAPTLIVWGDRDQFLPVENAVEMYQLIPNAQLAVIPNADHFVTRSRVDLFSSLVKEFLSDRKE
ncbi:MAG: alpha/beta hydrolase [Anaerolineales bacterium]